MGNKEGIYLIDHTSDQDLFFTDKDGNQRPIFNCNSLEVYNHVEELEPNNGKFQIKFYCYEQFNKYPHIQKEFYEMYKNNYGHKDIRVSFNQFKKNNYCIATINDSYLTVYYAFMIPKTGELYYKLDIAGIKHCTGDELKHLKRLKICLLEELLNTGFFIVESSGRVAELLKSRNKAPIIPSEHVVDLLSSDKSSDKNIEIELNSDFKLDDNSSQYTITKTYNEEKKYINKCILFGKFPSKCGTNINKQSCVPMCNQDKTLIEFNTTMAAIMESNIREINNL